MDIYYIPFENDYVIYRPLRGMAFLGNESLVTYLRERIAGRGMAPNQEIEALLDSIDFWAPDREMPDAPFSMENHRPTTAVLLMTSACNLRCTYCYAHGGEGPVRQLTYALATPIIDAAHENALALGRDRFSLVFHGGGEPTANWSVLTQSVEYALQKELPCDITMSTNGVLSKAKRDFVMDHFSSVSLSFDGIREVQDAQRPLPNGNGSFDAVMETIRTFDERDFLYGLRLTVTPQYFDILPRNIEFLCENCNCPSLQVEPAYSAARGDHSDPGKEESDAFIRAFLQAFDISSRHGRTLFYSGARPWSINTSFCSAAKEALIVNPSGNLVTCFEVHDDTHSLSEQFTVGRVQELNATNGLQLVPDKPLELPILQSGGGGCGSGCGTHTGSQISIDGGSLQAFIEEEHSRRAACHDCFAYWHCAGDCATRRSASLTKDYGRCHVNREITKELLAHYIAEGDGVWLGEGVSPRMQEVGALPSADESFR